MATAKPAPKEKTASARSRTAATNPAATRGSKPAAVTKSGAASSTAKKPAVTKAQAAAATAPSVKPIKQTFTKPGLLVHLTESSGQDPKAVKAVLEAIELTILGSVMKKGAGEFVFPTLFKISAQAVPARKARPGFNPISKEAITIPAQPATRRIKVRALKKLKDAAR